MEQSFSDQVCVSIIIPVYNLQDHLEVCLESIICQTYSKLQIILVDDGSTDNSLKICNQYAQKDSRVLVVHQENLGVSAARNAGLKKTVGKFVLFIDGDDTIASDYVEAYVFQAEITNADIVIGGLTKKEKARESIVKPLAGIYNTEEFFSLLCRSGTTVYGYVCCKLYRRSLIKENEIFFNEKMNSQEDLDFALSAYRNASKICCFDNTGYYYEYAPSNRDAIAENIIGNQIKLFSIAKDVGADTNTMLPRFQSIVYTWLYHADSVKAINEIIDIRIPDELIEPIAGQRREITRIIKLYKKKKSDNIYRYFYIRKIIRDILVKIHLVKPVE